MSKSLDTALLTSYAAIVLQAIIPIALGSHKSLKTPPEVLARRKRSKQLNGVISEDDEEEEDQGPEETLTWGDTLLFPVMGSLALMGFWIIIKKFGREWINRILGVYFTGAGMFAIQSTAGTIFKQILKFFGYKAPIYHIRVTSNLKQIFHLPISQSSLSLLPVSIAIPLIYFFYDKHWILSNIIALSISTATLGLIRLDSFMTAGISLGVLLVYDIFWVFATPVMVTVARSIDAPIKIIAPKDASGLDFTMLGLGDIIVPGLMVALCLRFDLYLHSLRNPKVDVTPSSTFPKRYFTMAMASYLVGLALTIFIMNWFQAAQPALLYLSPACVLGPVILGAIRGELKDLWAYSDVSEEIPEAKLDDTIEKGSEVAQKARAAAKAAETETGEESASPVEGDSENVGETVADDSWMDGSGVATGKNESVRKRRTKKK